MSPHPAALTITESSNGKQIELSPGQLFTLSLPENSTTGYTWQTVKDGRPAARMLRDFTEKHSDLIGAPGVHKWQFRAETAGASSVELHLVRPWEPGAVKQRLVFRLLVS